jgi:glycosyltransferase involved in cell wall biosynthesis
MASLVTVITPVGPVQEQFALDLTKCLNEVRSLVPDLEWSIAMDGPSPAVASIIQSSMSKSLAEVTTFSVLPRRSGPSAARNVAASSCDSRFLFWLDADDTVDPASFAAICSRLRNNNRTSGGRTDLVYADSFDCDQRLGVIATRVKAPLHALHSRLKGTLQDPVLGVDYVYQPQWVLRESFESISGFDETRPMGEDVDLILRLSELSRSVNFTHIPASVYYYRHNPLGICQTSSDSLFRSLEEVYTAAAQRCGHEVSSYRFHGSHPLRGASLVECEPDDIGVHEAQFDVYVPVLRSGSIVSRSYLRRHTPG